MFIYEQRLCTFRCFFYFFVKKSLLRIGISRIYSFNFPRTQHIYKIFSYLKLPWFSRQCVGLLDIKPGFEPQARHQNKIQKVCLRRFPLSRFLAKTLRINKIAMNSFSQNLSFGVDFKL